MTRAELIRRAGSRIELHRRVVIYALIAGLQEIEPVRVHLAVIDNEMTRTIRRRRAHDGHAPARADHVNFLPGKGPTCCAVGDLPFNARGKRVRGEGQ